MTKTSPHYRAWVSWCAMKSRCNNPNSTQFKWYGAKGVTVCERWAHFAAFLEDMGDPPDGHTLERIRGKEGYSKSNCRWATRKEQSNNRSSSVIITFNGERRNITQWAEFYKIQPKTLMRRVACGWPIDRDLFQPPLRSPARRIAPQNPKNPSTGRFITLSTTDHG